MESRISKPTDYALIQCVLQGETDLFAELISRYDEHLFKIVSRHIPAHEVAETAHDIFVEAFKSLANYSPDKPFENWLARIAVRRSYDYWRRAYRNRETPFSQIESIGFPEYEHPSSETDMQDWLDKLLDRLSPEDRMALTLVYLEERSIRETAELLGWSESKVKIRVHRAKERLRINSRNSVVEKGR